MSTMTLFLIAKRQRVFDQNILLSNPYKKYEDESGDPLLRSRKYQKLGEK